ncbi:MAG: hypothetical protein KBB37_09805 [Bacteroidia bacterium]|nr:hypothetical protein [Bacteroidia bacterium]MBP7261568.1 hypothetical protein [Bacteroidia bacterium]MBP9181105.1 hypothetical protein [Bacteroidia bacterium]MBP9724603.1 hypothetical protein [Bacteroidia bacterium]
MNRVFKAIGGILVAIVLGYCVYFFTVLTYSHSVDWDMDKQYLWLFKDSVIKEINTDYSYSDVEDRDVYNNFHYKDYNIVIWDFKDLRDANLQNVVIKNQVELGSSAVKFSSGEILNKKSDMEIAVKFRFAFSDAMNINIDTYSEIYKPIQGKNYKGFYGNLNKFSLSDGKDEHQIIFDYTEGKTQSVVLVYKNQRGFYLIVINSKQKLDENCIDVLNIE